MRNPSFMQVTQFLNYLVTSGCFWLLIYIVNQMFCVSKRVEDSATECIQVQRRLVDLGCVQINSRIKQENIGRDKTKDHETREKSLQIRENDLECSLQLNVQTKGALYFSFQLKIAFLVFLGWVPMLNAMSLSR